MALAEHREIFAAREDLRQALRALDDIAVPATHRPATDAEEDVIAAARRAWDQYLGLVERQYRKLRSVD